MSFPALAALTVLGERVTRLGLQTEDFLLMESYNEDPQTEKFKLRGRSGGTVYIAHIDPVLQISLNALVKERRGLANPVVGASLSLDAVQNYLAWSGGAAEDHMGYFPYAAGGASYGRLIVDRAVYGQPSRDGLHTITLTLAHELSAWSPHSHADPDGDGTGSVVVDDPVVIGGGVVGGETVDPDTGEPLFRTLRIFYHFTPPRGSTASERDGYVTRIMRRSTSPTMAQIYATGNPPRALWQSTPYYGPEPIVDGPAWDADDATATEHTATAGMYEITAVYELESNSMLMGDGTGLDKYDSATYGDCVVVVSYNSGARRLLIGNFLNLGSVLTELGLADTALLRSVWCPRTVEYYYFGTAVEGQDLLDFWRIERAQPVGPAFLQMFEVWGSRTVGKFNFLRVSQNVFDYGYSFTNANWPEPPPATHYNIGTTVAANPMDSLAAVYCASDDTWEVGDDTDVTALGYPAPAAGQDLWLFLRSANYGPSLSGTSDWVRGTIPNIAAFCAHYSLTNTQANLEYRFDYLFHANGAGGKGRYYVGSTAVADPWAVVGVSKF